MKEEAQQKDLRKVTKGGRMYYTTSDFFKRKKVIDLISKLEKSQVFHSIVNENKTAQNAA